MRNTTLLSLRTQARQRADMENSTFVSDAEVNTYINQSLTELYDIITTIYENYYMTSALISVVPNVNTYALPNDFFKLLGVDLVLDAQGNAVSLEPFVFGERNNYLFTPAFSVIGLSYLKYAVLGNGIRFVPTPQGAQQLKLWYVPVPTTLVADGDTFDGIDGWEEYIVIDAAMKMLIKEESDISALMAQKQMIMKRIEDSADSRDAGRPIKVTDINKTIPWETMSFGDYP